MTPDSPKGPERPRVTYEPRVGDRVMWRHLHFGTVRVDAHGESFISLDPCGTVYPSWRQHVQPDDGIGFPNWHDDSASEVERLTAEVERLRSMYDLAERQYAEQTGELKTDRDRYKAAHESTQRGLIRMEVQRDEARNERDEWKRAAEAETQGRQAEVSRLREQLATQAPAGVVERAALWLFRAKTSRLMPDVLQRASTTWHRVLDQQDRDAWISYAREMLADLGWGVSSSEAEAPPQHKVEFRPVWRGVGYAHCVTCGQQSEHGVEAYVSNWRDQHEADTLRPVGLTNESSISQEDEGRPSGSEAAAPRSDGDEVRALLIHPAAWNGLVKWLDSRSIYVQAAGELEGIPCWHMGVRDLSLANAGIRDQCDWWWDDSRCPDWAERGGDLCRLHRAERERYDAETERICAAKEQDAAQAARSEATPHPDQAVLLAKIEELKARGPVQYATEEASPPSGGDSDTTPRVWAVGDRVHRPAWNWTGLVRAAVPEVNRYRVQWDHMLDKPLSAGSSMCTSEELTEVPSPSSLPQEGGTDGQA